MPVTRKLLTCSACGAVVAEAAYRRWPPTLTLTSPDGYVVQPLGTALQIRVAERQVAEATSTGAAEHARARLTFLERSIGELVYDLTCRNGHSTLRTMPQVVRAVRRTPGRWVALD